MNTKIKKLLLAIIGEGKLYQPHAEVYAAAIHAGYLVFEDTYKKFGGEYGRGYVLTPTGFSFLQSK